MRLAPVPDLQRINQPEAQRSFRGKTDISIAGKPCATGARRGTDQAANNRAFASAGQASDHRASASTSANHGRGALTFALASFHGRCGVYVVIGSVNLDTGQCEFERRSAFEATRGLRVLNNAASTSALGNGYPSIDFHRLTDRGREILTWGADLRADGLIENDGNHGLGGDDEGAGSRTFALGRGTAGFGGRRRRVGVGRGGLLLIGRFLAAADQKD